MKTIKNRKRIYAHVFEKALLLTLLLSFLIGIVIAPPPEGKGKPEKPPFKPPPTQYYMFSIDLDGQELNLDSPDNLVAVSYADDSGWYVAPTKKRKAVDWHVSLNEFFNFPHPTGDCGIYTTVNLENVPTSIDAQGFDISYYWILTPHKGLGYDGRLGNFWELHINWGWNPNDPEDYSNCRSLHLWTDYGPEAEGTYYPTEDIWTVDFSGVGWELYAFDPDGHGYVENSGILSGDLTITIINNGPVSS